MIISELESKVVGHTIGRYKSNIENLDVLKIEENIKQLKPDICRLKINGSDDMLFDKLKQLNYPYEIYNINYYNIFDLSSVKKKEPPSELSYRQVIEGIEDKDFYIVLSNVLSARSWMEYNTFLTSHIFNENNKREAAIEYYQNFADDSNKASYTGLVYYDKTPIGLFMGYFTEDSFFGNLFGLVESFRNKGLSQYFYYFMYSECKKRNIKYFKNEVNLFNFKSQKSALTQGFLPKEIYYNLSIFPFCNINQSKFKIIELASFKLDALNLFIKSEFSEFEISTFKQKIYTKSNSFNKCILQSVISLSERKFIVIHFLDNFNHIVKSYYIYLQVII